MEITTDILDSIKKGFTFISHGRCNYQVPDNSAPVCANKADSFFIYIDGYTSLHHCCRECLNTLLLLQQHKDYRICKLDVKDLFYLRVKGVI